jgi:hypothetical protein
MTAITTSRPPANPVVIGLVSGVLVAIPAILAAVSSGGAGHGHYVAALALFPASMLLTLLQRDMVGVFSIIVGLLQFPVYGTLFGWSIMRKNYLPAVAVALAHLIAATICFAATLPNFS